MAIREVKMSRKNDEGEIVVLFNPAADWSPRLRNDAVNDIENDIHTYYVLSNGKRTDLKVVSDNNGKHLFINSTNELFNRIESINK